MNPHDQYSTAISPFPRVGKGPGIGADFHARRFDSQLGRWHATDPAGQFASPYVGMGNNPVNAVDPNGKWAMGGRHFYQRQLDNVRRELASQQQSWFDYLDMFSARLGSGLVGNTGIWHYSIGGNGGNAGISFTTESGSIISTKPEYWHESAAQAEGVFFNKSKGEYGNYYQTSGTIRYYLNNTGETVAVAVSEVNAIWIPAGGEIPSWNDEGWNTITTSDDGIILGGNPSTIRLVADYTIMIPIDFVGAGHDFLKNFRDMRKLNLRSSDKYFHSKANFQATRRGPGGAFFAIHFSNLREIYDQRIKGDTRIEAIEDQNANIYGREQGWLYRYSNGVIDFNVVLPRYRKDYFPQDY